MKLEKYPMPTRVEVNLAARAAVNELGTDAPWTDLFDATMEGLNSIDDGDLYEVEEMVDDGLDKALP